MKANYANDPFHSVDDFISVSDTDVISALNKAAKNPKLPGHADAKSLIYRTHRFRAIALPDQLKKEDLEKYKQNNGLKDTEIDWEFYKGEGCPDLSFPVSRRHVVIKKARDCSDLLLKVPAKRSNWVYISPEHDFDLIEFLEHRRA
jgi:hypothetical protein